MNSTLGVITGDNGTDATLPAEFAHRVLNSTTTTTVLPAELAHRLFNTTTSVALLISNTSTLNPITSGATEGSEEHEKCHLLSSTFGWVLQVLLGAFCFVSLVGKRFTDKVRRPWMVWFFDTSKQGISALLIHFLNIVLSMAFGAFLDSEADPCNWYWINLTLDDTFGIAILFLLLRCLKAFYQLECVGRPELALTGEYGDPPEYRIFCRQLLDWQGLVIVQKIFFSYLIISSFSDEVSAVADALLGWLDPHPKAKLVVVMIITPIVMNVFALWVADSFLQGNPEKMNPAAKLISEEAQARETFVGATPSVLGRRACCGKYDVANGSNARGASGSAPNGTVSGDLFLAGEDSDRVIGYQEWKKRAASLGRSGHGAARIPSLE